MKSNAKMVIIVAVLICLAVFSWMTLSNTRGQTQTKVTYSQFLQQVQAGQVASVVIEPGSQANPVICRLKDGNNVRTVLPSDYRDAIAAMQNKLVNIEIQDPASGWIPLLVNATPFLLLLGFWIFMMGRLRNGPRRGSLG
jgi:cell division protease FtsH